jgi:hypothetical protein
MLRKDNWKYVTYGSGTEVRQRRGDSGDWGAAGSTFSHLRVARFFPFVDIPQVIPRLYDMSKDPLEMNDLAKAQSDVRTNASPRVSCILSQGHATLTSLSFSLTGCKTARRRLKAYHRLPLCSRGGRVLQQRWVLEEEMLPRPLIRVRIIHFLVFAFFPGTESFAIWRNSFHSDEEWIKYMANGQIRWSESWSYDPDGARSRAVLVVMNRLVAYHGSASLTRVALRPLNLRTRLQAASRRLRSG